ncbi:MAG: hypothetical protein Q8K18_13445 [Burkholderiales bacterium]|nr:hypothetical protein [Burkholderiales bacterium]
MKRPRTRSREFELLASRIEGALAPKGAKVKSPDRIRDKITGQYREVDVSIRYTVGSCDLLITIECRDRSRVQDVTWIEQLATKRAHIGADRTIAVSSTDFTEAAVRAGAAHNISLRRISELTDDEISGLTSQLEVTIGFIDFTLGRMTLAYRYASDRPLALDEASRNLFNSLAWDAPIFRCNDAKDPVTLNDLIARSMPKPPGFPSMQSTGATNSLSATFSRNPILDHLPEVPADGSPISDTLTLHIEDEDVSVQTDQGPKLLRELSFEVTAQRRTEQISASRVADYSDEHRIVGRFTEHEVQLGGNRSLRVFSHPTIESNTEALGKPDET